MDVAAELKKIRKLGGAVREGVEGSQADLAIALRSALDKVEPPEERLWRTLWAEPCHHSVLKIANDLQIFQHLAADNDSSKCSSQIAVMSNADPDFVRRIMRLMASMGSVREVGQDHFVNSSMSKLFLQPQYSESLSFSMDTISPMQLQAASYFKQTGYRSPNDIRDGIFQHVNDCKGKTFFEWTTTHDRSVPGALYQFGQMMTAWSENRTHWLHPDYYPAALRLGHGARTDKDAVLIVDVGGSTGHDLDLFVEANPGIPGRLVLQDLPEIIAQARPRSSRIEATVHDFFTLQPIKDQADEIIFLLSTPGARAYYLHSILHDWSDTNCIRILSALKPALDPSYSRVLVQVMVVPDSEAPWQLTSLDWSLMQFFSGRERSKSEWRSLIEQVEGLKMVQIFKHPSSVDSVIEIGLAG